MCTCVLQQVDELYKASEQALGSSSLLHLLIAQHQRAYHSNMHMEIMHLRAAEVGFVDVDFVREDAAMTCDIRRDLLSVVFSLRAGLLLRLLLS